MLSTTSYARSDGTIEICQDMVQVLQPWARMGQDKKWKWKSQDKVKVAADVLLCEGCWVGKFVCLILDTFRSIQLVWTGWSTAPSALFASGAVLFSRDKIGIKAMNFVIWRFHWLAPLLWLLHCSVSKFDGHVHSVVFWIRDGRDGDVFKGRSACCFLKSCARGFHSRRDKIESCLIKSSDLDSALIILYYVTSRLKSALYEIAHVKTCHCHCIKVYADICSLRLLLV